MNMNFIDKLVEAIRNMKLLKTTYHIRLERWHTTTRSTIGMLFEVKGRSQFFLCYTLEDPVRDTKIYGDTAIPAGIYKVVINFSRKYKCFLPLLKKVLGFKGVRIHSGNSPKDTKGCILVGDYNGRPNWVGKSRTTFKKVFKLMQEAKKAGKKIILEIV